MQTIKGIENINESLQTHFLIYKITNNVNGKHYIGQHQTNDPYDNYMGSGRLMLKALQKYDLSSFTKEILFDFDNFEDMNNKEKELVPLSACYPYDLMSYNLREGGYNSQLSEYSTQKLSISQHNRLQNLSDEQREQWLKKLSIASTGKNNPMYGDFEHTKGFRAENKKRKGKTWEEIFGKDKAAKIKSKTSKSTAGKNNGCYGKKWFYNPTTKDKIFISQKDIQIYKKLGYIEGTGCQPSKGYKWINNGIKQMQIHPTKIDEYISNGWNIGKLKTTRKMIDPNTGKYKYVKPQNFQFYLNQGYVFGTSKKKINVQRKA